MKKPNILLILTDQQRHDTVEALGNPVIKTPNLNRLVERGVTFNRAYSQCPVCVPARFGMLTGQMPHRAGLFENVLMPEGWKSVMEILSENGYQTHGTGKMHFTFRHPVEGLYDSWGFESRDISEEYGKENMDEYRKMLKAEGYEHVKEVLGMGADMYYIPQPSQVPEKLHNTNWTADKSIEFLQNRDKERPFFLMTSFVKPHPPFESPYPWSRLYSPYHMPMPKRPEKSEELITLWNRFQNRYKNRAEGLDDHLIRSMKAAYYGSISYIDYNIGKIMEYMENNNMMEDTIVIFTSDHGELMGDYNCFGKRCFFDSSARVPMIMYHPGLENKGSICETPVSLVDIFSTLLDCAGVEYEGACSGRSLVEAAKGTMEREVVYGQFSQGEYGMYMAASRDYKYIYSAPDCKEWLYDLRIDPEETINKAEDSDYSEILNGMKNNIINYFIEEGYTEPLNGQDWKRYSPKEVPEKTPGLAHLNNGRLEYPIPEVKGYTVK